MGNGVRTTRLRGEMGCRHDSHQPRPAPPGQDGVSESRGIGGWSRTRPRSSRSVARPRSWGQRLARRHERGVGKCVRSVSRCARPRCPGARLPGDRQMVPQGVMIAARAGRHLVVAATVTVVPPGGHGRLAPCVPSSTFCGWCSAAGCWPSSICSSVCSPASSS